LPIIGVLTLIGKFHNQLYMNDVLVYIGKVVKGGRKRDIEYYSVWIGNKQKLKELLGKKVLVIIIPFDD